jgi:hypothetical protein
MLVPTIQSEIDIRDLILIQLIPNPTIIRSLQKDLQAPFESSLRSEYLISMEYAAIYISLYKLTQPDLKRYSLQGRNQE